MSENIFTELYNKILGLFGQSAQKEDSKDVAVNRLRVVLMQDRTNLTPELLQRMRKELIDLLSKYVEMDKEALELNFEQEGEQMALMLSIPVVRAKDEEEIEAAIKAEEEAKKLTETDDEDDSEDDLDFENADDDDSEDEDLDVEDDDSDEPDEDEPSEDINSEQEEKEEEEEE
ncbi:cell division topological specificity factor MinE [bacterium]|nr:cell division topological specificity factor MinE [bacterium]